MTIDEINTPIANLPPKKAVSYMTSDGLDKGEDIKKAITVPHGSDDTNMDNNTAIVPQAHNGVKAPKRTAPGIDIPDFLSKKLFNLLVSKYTFITTAIKIPIRSIYQSALRYPATAPKIVLKKLTIINTPFLFVLYKHCFKKFSSILDLLF
jgi:hypothetical protein